MNIEIREACIDDIPIVAWTVLAALDMNDDDMEACINSCADERSLYSWRHAIIAFVDGVEVGCLIAYEGTHYREMREYTWPSLWNDVDPEYMSSIEMETKSGEFYLDSMAIKAEYRGLGIGKLLIQYAVEKGKWCGCERATLLVDQHKPHLQSYYESFGFEKYGEMEYFGHDYNKMKYTI